MIEGRRLAGSLREHHRGSTTEFGTGMATVIGRSDSAEMALLRRALDDGGFEEGADPYGVRLLDAPLPPAPDWVEDGDGRVLVVACGERHESGVWGLLAQGVEDVISWTGEETVAVVVARLERWREVDRVLSSRVVASLVHGGSAATRRLLVDLVELAVYGSGPILLVGETGTGKELAARLVHAVNEESASLVVVDCTTIVASLSGSELFGHEKGAFTGADRARAGAFAAADGGTLFLDEIGELPLALQVELLRVLQEGTYKRVGGDTWSRTRFRLVSATNRDLEEEQRQGRFRSDLYHRIASGIVRLPPLRERTDDLEDLFRHFLAEAAGRPLEVAPSVVALLHDRDYPGNLRELRQLAYAVAARHAGPGAVSPGDVPLQYRPAGPAADPPVPSRRLLDRAVRAGLSEGLSLPDLKTLVGDVAVEAALARCDGNVHRAAALLGVTDRAVQLRRQVPRPRAGKKAQ
ncbi:sigma 54-interacting transcriptional regulator [Nocardioides renjunii]|uniref:sigma 54-interacting transcriptional regulator n=1 Tax=Nocardioides renjunii TaxID=3095075 RepID=UPI002B002612|nr:sigma 54-interacting transcriptional regulator [Nocardioides sp. S-34]WQQ20557.1 sigma 54-interacting transcriptional regulator [Nocardioides sp. S-34]